MLLVLASAVDLVQAGELVSVALAVVVLTTVLLLDLLVVTTGHVGATTITTMLPVYVTLVRQPLLRPTTMVEALQLLLVAR